MVEIAPPRQSVVRLFPVVSDCFFCKGFFLIFSGLKTIGGKLTCWTPYLREGGAGIFRDAGAILYRKIDYRNEANNVARFAADFGIGVGGKAVECAVRGLDGRGLLSTARWMRMPYTYRKVRLEMFLVMEYVPR